MRFFSSLADFTGSVLTPLCLFLASAGVVSVTGLKKLFRFSDLLRRPKGKKEGTSPAAALSLALAGTLGAGNITGVASALMAGGPGAVFWMWMGAIIAVPVKYAEVRFAVRYRRRRGTEWTGGSMYTIRDGLGSLFPSPSGRKTAERLASLFAVLCAANALVTGNLVQSNAAVCLLPAGRKPLWGVLLALAVALSVLAGTRKIEKTAARLMPPLTAFYILVSLAAVLPHARMIPSLLRLILSSAFSSRAFGAGIAGFSVREAVRCGVMRGIFSNEAGCGTSPSAHAAAETDSEERQALLGVCEVIFDTLILCTLTALVLLTSDAVSGGFPWHTASDAAPAAMEAFEALAGEFAAMGVRIAAVLFAYASIIAQIYYGMTAVRFLTENRTAGNMFLALSAVMPLIGAAISPGTRTILLTVVLSAAMALIFPRKEDDAGA